jgi:hypothetical protein
MPYTRAEIDDLAIHQLRAEELDRAVVAFNGFEQTFGQNWIADFFRGVWSPGFVSYIRALWEDWVLVRDLAQSDTLSQRWSAGIGKAGVEAEVKFVGFLLREGVAVELYQEVESGKVPDCRFRVEDTWVYAEVSQRGISEVRRQSRQALQELAAAAARAVPGYHGKLAVLRLPSPEEVGRILVWLGSLKSAAETQFDDLAVFYGDALESATSDSDRIAQLAPIPHMFTTHICGAAVKGTVCLGITDNAAGAVLKAEASQLPTSAPGLIVLDISSVIGSYPEWAPLIQRRLQPTINRRISGVVLYESLHGTHGPTMKGTFLQNGYARQPLPEGAAQLARKFYQRME